MLTAHTLASLLPVTWQYAVHGGAVCYLVSSRGVCLWAFQMCNGVFHHWILPSLLKGLKGGNRGGKLNNRQWSATVCVWLHWWIGQWEKEETKTETEEEVNQIDAPDIQLIALNLTVCANVFRGAGWELKEDTEGNGDKWVTPAGKQVKFLRSLEEKTEEHAGTGSHSPLQAVELNQVCKDITHLHLQ